MKLLLWGAAAAAGVFLYVVLPSNLIPPLHDWAHAHEGLTIALMFAPMPLALLAGSFAIAVAMIASVAGERPGASVRAGGGASSTC